MAGLFRQVLFFSAMLGSGNYVGFVERPCRLFGRDNVNKKEASASIAVVLMWSLLRNRGGPTAKTVLLLISKITCNSELGLLFTTCVSFSSSITALNEGFSFANLSKAAKKKCSHENTLKSSGFEGCSILSSPSLGGSFPALCWSMTCEAASGIDILHTFFTFI